MPAEMVMSERGRVSNTRKFRLKAEFISHNLYERTSWGELLRRLIVAGPVRQSDNQRDKKSKHIAIKDEGKTLLYQVFTDMNNVGKMIPGKLMLAEKFTLLICCKSSITSTWIMMKRRPL
ncbi:hypothetical protein [Mucilaginibacter ginsenosidivorax]|nr:hypothetical protein [Mucilaginibacter ginsenosidivorax]